jgi:menaquinol-cytochrome c reductase cytochrome b/c subunit
VSAVREPRQTGTAAKGDGKADPRRAEFARYKEDVRKHGMPFHPYAMLHDTIMSVVVVAVIVGLACLWYFTSGEEAGDAGVLGPRYTEKADPGTISFVPRPDWYFYFLFYLLRIFKWPESVVLGTVGIPTIAIILLLAVPFLDRRMERRLSRRPVAVISALLVIASMAVLTWKGATVKEASIGAEEQVPAWIEQNNLVDNAAQVPGADPATAEADVTAGAELFAESGCLNCHVYLDSGAQALGAPELTAEGLKNRGIEWQIGHLKNPSQFTPGSPMPSFAGLTEDQLRQLAIFLEASQGPGG